MKTEKLKNTETIAKGLTMTGDKKRILIECEKYRIDLQDPFTKSSFRTLKRDNVAFIVFENSDKTTLIKIEQALDIEKLKKEKLEDIGFELMSYIEEAHSLTKQFTLKEILNR